VAAAEPDLPERDLGDGLLLPGFVDAHCHLEWSLTGAAPAEAGFSAWLEAMLRAGERLTPGDLAAAADAGALRCAEAGTTAVADSGPTGAGAGALRRTGLRGICHLEAFGRQTADAARDAAAAFAAAVAALDDGGERVRIGVAPHAPYTVGPELWAALAARPELAARPWTTHLAESPDESQVIADGTGPLAAPFAARGRAPGRWPGRGSPVRRLAEAGALRRGLVAAHCVQLDDGDELHLARAGVAVAHCPGSNRALGCGRAPIERLAAAGVGVGLGTDSPASAGAYDLRAEARTAIAVHAGAADVDAAGAVRMITLGGAEALGLDGLVGSLDPGKRADLVLLDRPRAVTDPWRAALSPDATVRTVWVDGRVVVDDGRAVSVDRDAILAAAERVRRAATG
jgi:5-methylthioadenosine/S-adenosylhomocysteine deaminase